MLRTDPYLHGKHHRPVRVSLLLPFLNLTVTRSEKIVNKSFVLSFFTINGSEIPTRCRSSRSSYHLGEHQIQQLWTHSNTSVLFSAIDSLGSPSSRTLITSGSLSSASLSSTMGLASTTRLAFLRGRANMASASCSLLELLELVESTSLPLSDVCRLWVLLPPCFLAEVVPLHCFLADFLCLAM